MDTRNNDTIIHVHVDMSEMDEVTQKALELNKLLEKASSLADELASRTIELSVEIENVEIEN